MASPQTITGLTLLKLGNLSYATLVVTDPNGNLAMGTTPMYQTPSGILVPGPADANGYPYTKLAGNLVTLPSPGETLLVGPSADISIAPGASYTTPSFNALGNRMIGYFMDASLSSTATVSSTLIAQSQLLTNQQSMYITGAGQEDYNTNGWTNQSAVMTGTYAVTFYAASGNTTDATINGVSVGIG